MACVVQRSRHWREQVDRMPANLRPWLDSSAGVLWFEWDLPGGAAVGPHVSVSPTPELGVSCGVPAAAQLATAARILESSQHHDLLAHPTLLEACRALPEPRAIAHLGLAPDRQRRFLRVAVHLAADRVLPWLLAIGWPGDRERARSLLSLMFGFVGIQLELTDEGWTPYLDVEFPGRLQPSVVRWLVEVAGVAPHRLDAVRSWRRSFTDRSGDTPWRVQRRYYLKVRYNHGWRVKAYLGAMAVSRGSR